MVTLFGGKNSKVAAVFLISATIITIARLLAPFEVEKDQALQMEASLRLVDGAGMTTTSVKQTSFDLSEPSKPEYLTWFPPAFSLILAGFLYLGVPLLLSLKIIYGLTTLIGWMCWAILAAGLMSKPIKIFGRDIHLNYLIAAVIPLLLTPPWKGTDIFLWAGIPLFVLLLLKAAKGPSTYRYIFAASLLFGLLVSFRYASFFLGLSGFFIIVQTSWPSIPAFLKRFSVFLLPALVTVLAVTIYIKLFSIHDSYAPEYINPASHASRIPRMIFGMLNGSSITSNLVIGSPVLERLCARMDSSILSLAIGIPSLLVIFLLPLALIRPLRSKSESPQTDMALSLSLIPVSLVLFLVVSTFMSGNGLFGVSRYYWPASLCGVFIFYEISSNRASNRVVKAAANIIILLFAGYLFAYIPAMGFIPRKQGEFVERVMSYTPSKAGSLDRPSTSSETGYPSYSMFSRKESSRSKIKELHEANPGAIFLVLENYVYYIYDGFKEGGLVAGKDIRRFHANDWTYWKEAYTSKPVKVFWVLDYPSASVTRDNLNIIPDSNLKAVFSDQFEKTLILESDFPAGHRLVGP
ncbi:MAG TPA: hypothetical protein VIG62_12965 [Blastocatellia bacterium]